MRLVITGVTGFIGRNLATRALEAGFDVTGLSRRAWTGEPYVPLDDRHFLELPVAPDPSVLRGADAVVHLAVAPQGAAPAVVDAVNVLGTMRCFDAAGAAGVDRFVFVSSQSAHSDAASAYGRSKFAAEQQLGKDRRVVIVRPGMVFGDSSEGLVGRAWVASKSHVFPVIGGSVARVQPIRVEELCDALLTLATMTNPPSLVELADPEVRPLGEFLRARVREQYGVWAVAVPVPLAPTRALVRLVSSLHLPSPIDTANIDGIAAFEPMDTADDLARVGLGDSSSATARWPRHAVAPVEPRRVLLIGAGRIGLVHAITAAHHQHMVAVGMVDLDRAAMGRVASFAGPLSAFTDLDEALSSLKPDAAIISTPPSSHVPLAQKLLAAGVDVLVEKPVAASDADRLALTAAIERQDDRYLATGYLYGLLPHVAAIAGDLRGGRFGTPTGFEGQAFVSRVEEGVADKRGMWELDPSVSGGGALVNLGVHILAMLDFLLGPIDVVSSVLVTSRGRATEDGAALMLRAGGVTGSFATAWHLPGFEMSENELRIKTDRGLVICSTSCAAFIGDGERHVVHQADADAAFDLAPMDAGGAFWAEQDLLARRVSGANSLALAGRIEDLITHVYRTAERIESPAHEPGPRLPPVATVGGPVLPDLRAASADAADSWPGPKLIGTAAGRTDEAIIALPDAPGHFRTLTNKGPVQLVRDLGVSPLARAAFGVSPRGVASSSGRSWEALRVLMRAELRRIGRGYRGSLVVDAYLVDLATATGNVGVISAALDDLRDYCPGAQIGIEVNATSRLVPHLPAVAARLDLVVALSTPRSAGLASLRELLMPTTELIAKTGVLPRELLEIAWDDPDAWTAGRGPLVVHWSGAPAFRKVDRDRIARATRVAGLASS